MKVSLGYYLKIPAELKYLKVACQMVKLLILAEEQKVRVRLALLVAVQALAVLLVQALLQVIFSHQDVILLITIKRLFGILLFRLGVPMEVMLQVLELMEAHPLMALMIKLEMLESGLMEIQVRLGLQYMAMVMHSSNP